MLEASPRLFCGPREPGERPATNKGRPAVRHCPASRFHPELCGVSHSRAPHARGRTAILAAIFYAAGFFTGAILFGEALLLLHR